MPSCLSATGTPRPECQIVPTCVMSQGLPEPTPVAPAEVVTITDARSRFGSLVRRAAHSRRSLLSIRAQPRRRGVPCTISRAERDDERQGFAEANVSGKA
jgi:hypothetical protein